VNIRGVREMAENKQVITDEIVENILDIKESGICNMFDTNSVQI
jgi:hypothetical protein